MPRAALAGPGHCMRREMAEQPSVLANLLGRAGDLRELVRSIVPRPLYGIALAARGCSDHASVGGRYVLELSAPRPVSLLAPSLRVLCGARVDYRGISVMHGRRGGLAITNDPVWDTIAGSTLILDRALANLVSRCGVPVPQAATMASTTPATLLGVQDRKGSIAPGRDADLVILDPDTRLAGVLVRGVRARQLQEEP